MCLNSIDFRRGDACPELVFLGACPGQEEWTANPQRPFAGRSGINLSSLLDVLRALPDKEMYGLLPNDFQSNIPDDYTLMNSHAVAKWDARDGRTTPRMPEVECPDNIVRLTGQLHAVGARVVIGLGRPLNDVHLNSRGRDSAPMRAIRQLVPNHQEITFLITGHPSPRAINRFGGGDVRRWFETKLWRFPVE